MYVARSAAYPAKSGVDEGVEPGDQRTMKGSAGEVSSCAYWIGSDEKIRTNARVLKLPRKQDAGQQYAITPVKTFEVLTNVIQECTKILSTARTLIASLHAFVESL